MRCQINTSTSLSEMLGINLQLREQFRIYTGFPFNPTGNLLAGTKIQGESNHSV